MHAPKCEIHCSLTLIFSNTETAAKMTGFASFESSGFNYGMPDEERGISSLRSWGLEQIREVVEEDSQVGVKLTTTFWMSGIQLLILFLQEKKCHLQNFCMLG